MKRILILGASGTFGKALVEKLSNDKECHLTLASRHASAFYHESERCHVIDCDAMKTDDLQQAMTSCHVVYCSISGDNLPIIVENTVSAMKKAGLRRLIFMGAVGIYDEIPADMDDEDNVKNNPDQIPQSGGYCGKQRSGLHDTSSGIFTGRG